LTARQSASQAFSPPSLFFLEVPTLFSFPSLSAPLLSRRQSIFPRLIFTAGRPRADLGHCHRDVNERRRSQRVMEHTVDMTPCRHSCGVETREASGDSGRQAAQVRQLVSLLQEDRSEAQGTLLRGGLIRVEAQGGGFFAPHPRRSSEHLPTPRRHCHGTPPHLTFSSMSPIV
jgi:hypothetical protein